MKISISYFLPAILLLLFLPQTRAQDDPTPVVVEQSWDRQHWYAPGSLPPNPYYHPVVGPSPEEIRKKAAAATADQDGLLALNDQNWDQAIKDFQEALKNEPGDQTVMQHLQAARDHQQIATDAVAQAEFQANKLNALNNSLHDNLLNTRSDKSDFDELENGSFDSAPTQSRGLDGSLGLKDAVADNSDDQKLFENKNAIEDALTAKAHGSAGFDQLAGWLPNSSVNPELGSALERAKAETNLRFDERTANVGEFDTVVIAGNSRTPGQTQSEILHAPDSLKNDPRFQRLIIERDALQHQAQGVETQIKGIEADSSYQQDSKRLNQLDRLKITDSNLNGMAGCLNNLAGQVVKGTITIDKVTFDESPTPQKRLDNIQVPPPSS